jgi:hypothetical protein
MSPLLQNQFVSSRLFIPAVRHVLIRRARSNRSTDALGLGTSAWHCCATVGANLNPGQPLSLPVTTGEPIPLSSTIWTMERVPGHRFETEGCVWA